VGELVVLEEFLDVGPDQPQAVDDAAAGFLRAEGQAEDPLRTVVAVVVHFLHGLGGDGG
jgi:hypothetical protein